MRFTGQVRVPEVDHPGVPATIVVEEGQTEVFLEGESLGRWSLYDVQASRLVSSAFSLSLAGEEITFIADEPVDFAYKGVDHMAGVWARYKSMTIPRRVVAVGRSRRGTIPSRISELREAMLHNLQTAGRGASVMTTIEAATPAAAEPAPWTKRIDAYSNVPEPIDVEEQVETDAEPVARVDLESVPGPEPEAVVEPEPEPEAVVEPDLPVGAVPAPEPASVEMTDASPVATEPEIEEQTVVEPDPTPPQSAPLRPGPGLIPRRVERRPIPQPAEASDWELAWEEPPVHEEMYDDMPADADLVLIDSEPGVEAEDVPDVAPVEALVDDEAEPVLDDIDGSEPEPEPVEDWPRVITDDSGHRELVLDLGHLEEGLRAGVKLESLTVPRPGAEPSSIEPDLELLFAGAPAPEAEKSGLLGAVRSAFARNKTSHEHEFVEAPGGIGIVRQICADCGYISIGISD